MHNEGEVSNTLLMMEKPDEISEEAFNRLYNESHIPALGKRIGITLDPID